MTPLPSSLAFHNLMSVNERPAEVFVRGEGAWLWDAVGNRYLDWLQGWAVNALGHCPSVVTQALQTQASLLLTPSPAFHNAPSLALAQTLCRLSGFDKAFFGSTGAEANEGAIKLARKWGRVHRGGAYEIITFHNAFHGRNWPPWPQAAKRVGTLFFLPICQGLCRCHSIKLKRCKQH